MRPVKREFGKAYLDLNPALQRAVKAVLERAASAALDDRDAYPYPSEREVEELECRSRDGFMAASHNCGGYRVRVFERVDLAGTFGSALANKAVADTLNQANEHAQEELKARLVANETEEQRYERIREFEDSYLSDETVMIELQVMYGGFNETTQRHTAWVSTYLNWEAPYHRSSGAVYREMGCRGKPVRFDDHVEIEIEFRTVAEFRTKAARALKRASKLINK